MDKFKGKYRRTSTRLQHWDYRWAAAYFITLNTKDRQHYFGKIAEGKMILSSVGIIADLLWHEIPYHSKNIEPGEFVIMPDHIHLILIITKDPVDRINLLGPDRYQNIGKNSVSSIIGSYKSAVTKHANRYGLPFVWQSLFYDHIIRDELAFIRISEYIRKNPEKWSG